MKILFVCNEGNFFLSHRLPLAREAQHQGMDVLVVCGAATGEENVRSAELAVRTVPLSRSGFNPFEELRSLRALYQVYREERPDLVHHITIKPAPRSSVPRWSRRARV